MGRVRHVRSGGEVQVLSPAEMVFVDGFDQEINTIYEFYGCYFHGCSRCFPRNRDVRRNCHKDRTVNEVYYTTEKKAAMLRQAGYQVIEKWECDFNPDKKTDPQLKSFLQDLKMVPPLEPRDAFYGFRTAAATLYAKGDPGEDIKYCVVTSLYPWVNKYKEYPVRFPIIYTNPSQQDIDQYFGVAQVDILAPEHLYHPVLPVHSNGKLTFPLCASCVREEQA